MRLALLLFVACGFVTSSPAADRDVRVRAAVQKVVPWLEKGAVGSSQHNQCFTCHNHALPIMALTEARRNGLDIDSEVLHAQIEHTKKFLASGKKRYEQGKGQGGRVLTAGYALWALQASGEKPDDVTNAVAGYILQDQKDKDHWTKHGRRPPSDGNEFTTTFVALQGLQAYHDEETGSLRQQRFDSARDWADRTPASETEDLVFRLRTLVLARAPAESVQAAVDQLLKVQRDDGGWAQTDDMTSDAYATGTVLATMLAHKEASLPDSAVDAAVDYLLNSQLDDGTWHVVSRADAFQEYYESGFPHGEDQFISIAASSWAAMALLRSLSPND